MAHADQDSHQALPCAGLGRGDCPLVAVRDDGRISPDVCAEARRPPRGRAARHAGGGGGAWLLVSLESAPTGVGRTRTGSVVTDKVDPTHEDAPRRPTSNLRVPDNRPAQADAEAPLLEI